LTLMLRNRRETASVLTVKAGAYPRGAPRRYALAPGAVVKDAWRLDAAAPWYDLAVASDGDPAFLRQLAGHMETGRPSSSDPAIGRG
jgi:phospholipase C